MNTINLQRAKGFSLVELMVGVVLSLILMAAAITVYISSKQTNTLNESLVSIQNEGQLALQVLKEHIRKAGWVEDTALTFSLATPLVDGKFTDGGGFASDTLAIQYEGGVDCNGTAVANPVQDTFSVTGNTLMCNGQPIIDNVDTFQVLYGIDGDSGFEYVTANNVTDITSVRSVQIGLMLTSENEMPNGKYQSGIQVLDTTMPTASDKKIRQVYSTTIVILNRPQNFTLTSS